jgi:hypothetical protein
MSSSLCEFLLSQVICAAGSAYPYHSAGGLISQFDKLSGISGRPSLQSEGGHPWYPLGNAAFFEKISDEKRTAQTERKDIEVAQERLKRLRDQQRAKEKRQTGRPPHKGKRPE